MSGLTPYTIEQIRHEMSQLRAAVNYAIEMLDGIEKAAPDATAQVQQAPVPNGGWPPCENPPCYITLPDLSATGDVIRIRGKNVDNLFLALKHGPHAQDIAGAEYSPRSRPLSIPPEGLQEIADQPDPETQK